MSDLAVAAVAVSAGIGGWTFTEYVIHRWFMHEELGPTIASQGHLDHHRRPTQRPLASPLSVVAALILGVFVVAPIGAWFATVVGAAWFAGALLGLAGTAGYFIYERVHFQAHFRPARTRYTRWQQRRHLHHHSQGGSTNYGVTSPLWDVVFGTYERVDADEPLPAHTTAF